MQNECPECPEGDEADKFDITLGGNQNSNSH